MSYTGIASETTFQSVWADRVTAADAPVSAHMGL